MAASSGVADRQKQSFGWRAVRPITQTPSPVEPPLVREAARWGNQRRKRIQRMARLERIAARAAYEAEAAGAVASSWDCDILAGLLLPDHHGSCSPCSSTVVFGANEVPRIIIQD